MGEIFAAKDVASALKRVEAERRYGLITKKWDFYFQTSGEHVATFYVTPPVEMLTNKKFDHTIITDTLSGVRCWKLYNHPLAPLKEVYMFPLLSERKEFIQSEVITETIEGFHPAINFYRKAIGYGAADRIKVLQRKISNLRYIDYQTIAGECSAFSKRLTIYCSQYEDLWRWDSDLDWRKQ